MEATHHTSPRHPAHWPSDINARALHIPELPFIPPLLHLSLPPGDPRDDAVIDFVEAAGLPPFHVTGDGTWEVDDARGDAWSIETSPGGPTTVWCPDPSAVRLPPGLAADSSWPAGPRAHLLEHMRLRGAPPGWHQATVRAGRIVLLFGSAAGLDSGPRNFHATMRTLTGNRTLCGNVYLPGHRPGPPPRTPRSPSRPAPS